MSEIKGEILIARPAAEVFDLVADQRRSRLGLRGLRVREALCH